MAVKQNAIGSKAPDGSDYVTLTDGTGNLGSVVSGITGAAADNADARANVATGLVPSVADQYLYNNVTWDRQRSVINATNSIGTGIAATGILAQFDDVSPTAITENQFGNVRMGAERGLYASPMASTVGGSSYLNIAAGQATTVVKASAGTLYSIVLNSAATATNTTVVYDHPSGVGTVIGRPAVTTATVPTTLTFGPTGLAFANGLTIITAVANGGDMTVCYK